MMTTIRNEIDDGGLVSNEILVECPCGNKYPEIERSRFFTERHGQAFSCAVIFECYQCDTRWSKTDNCSPVMLTKEVANAESEDN